MGKSTKELLKEARTRFGQTQYEAALDIGINVQTYRFYEYGVIPSAPTLEKIKSWMERNNKRIGKNV